MRDELARKLYNVAFEILNANDAFSGMAYMRHDKSVGSFEGKIKRRESLRGRKMAMINDKGGDGIGERGWRERGCGTIKVYIFMKENMDSNHVHIV